MSNFKIIYHHLKTFSLAEAQNSVLFIYLHYILSKGVKVVASRLLTREAVKQ